MDLLVDTADALQRRRQGTWLHEMHAETKRLCELAAETRRHYDATLAALKAIARSYANINTLLVSVSRNFSDVSAGSRIGVSTNVQKFKTMVTTLDESPQARLLQKVLREQEKDAAELKLRVKESFAVLKKRDQQYGALDSARPSSSQRSRQLECEAALGKDVRSLYATASRLVDKECIGFVRAYTGGASAVIQLVRDRYTRSLLAATDAVGGSHGYPVTGVVQHPAVAQEVMAAVDLRTDSPDSGGGDYGVNGNGYVSDASRDAPMAVGAVLPMLQGDQRRASAGMPLAYSG